MDTAKRNDVEDFLHFFSLGGAYYCECRRIAAALAALCIGILSSCGGGGGGDSPPNNPSLSSNKAITSFSFASPSATGTVDETAKAVTVNVPSGTDVTALVATFVTTGTSVRVNGVEQASGTTPNNVTNPVGYVVTAEDSSSATYTVTVSTGGNTAAPAGSLDTSFGTAGTVTTAVGDYHDYGNAVAIQPNGKIVVAGTAYADATGNDFAVVRYNTDGTLDTGFHTTGTTTTTFTAAGHDYANAVALQNDGKIVVAGYADTGSNFKFALARYNTDGSLDMDFGIGGKVITALGSYADTAPAVAIQADGKIVAAGSSVDDYHIPTSPSYGIILRQDRARLLESRLPADSAGSFTLMLYLLEERDQT